MTTNELIEFRESLGYSESGNNYYKDTGEYWGKYQFGEERRKDIEAILGLHHLTRQEFTPDMQERFFSVHVNDIEKKLYNDKLDLYFGKEVTGKTNKITAKINKYGIIAGAHIGGYEGLKSFLKSNFVNDKKDSFGTYISDYVAKFSYLMDKKKLITTLNLQQYFSQLQQSITLVNKELNNINNVIQKIKIAIS
ncbi:MAG: hypothetical protein QXF76_04035 [Candidatus Anstonellales archaeon]